MTDAPCCGQMDKSDGVASKLPCKSGQERKIRLLQATVIKNTSPLPARPEILLTQPVIKQKPVGLWRPPRFV